MLNVDPTRAWFGTSSIVAHFSRHVFFGGLRARASTSRSSCAVGAVRRAVPLMTAFPSRRRNSRLKSRTQWSRTVYFRGQELRDSCCWCLPHYLPSSHVVTIIATTFSVEYSWAWMSMTHTCVVCALEVSFLARRGPCPKWWGFALSVAEKSCSCST